MLDGTSQGYCDLKEHHEKQCPMRIVTCPHCAQTGQARDIEEHSPTCDKRKVQRPLGCGKELLLVEAATHAVTYWARCVPRDQYSRTNESPMSIGETLAHGMR